MVAAGSCHDLHQVHAAGEKQRQITRPGVDIDLVDQVLGMSCYAGRAIAGVADTRTGTANCLQRTVGQRDSVGPKANALMKSEGMRKPPAMIRVTLFFVPFPWPAASRNFLARANAAIVGTEI
ncbi:hypothetical protein SAMN05216417_10232 [Nitrosospira multiformis]|uniref:Uncharacterized protein n=1 Tax=Nitrosospira multiformis TaxID=1231 RepID=A0A1I7FNE3_9PROT|nr:hypothetical protein SAMN05216417_10232 [Nitrosospira multiformis]